MSKLRSIVPKMLTIAFGLFFATGCVSQQGAQGFRTLIPDVHNDEILFREINKSTSFAKLSKLRETRIPDGDIEVRIWRGDGLYPLEGVVIKRTNGTWSGLHLKASRYTEPQSVRVETLSQPKSGWESFWKSLLDKGMLTIQESTENECNIPGLDGMVYVVEINRDKTYRYYYYPESEKCPEARQTKEIGETIGLEFDSGSEECKTTEWFPCMTYRKSH